MGVVFQDFRLLDHLTTYENVALPLRVQGRAETSYRAEVVELLRWVGLGERMKAIGELDAEIAALEERWFALTELLGDYRHQLAQAQELQSGQDGSARASEGENGRGLRDGI